MSLPFNKIILSLAMLFLLALSSGAAPVWANDDDDKKKPAAEGVLKESEAKKIGGFKGPSLEVNPVRLVKGMPNNTRVRLQGHLERALSDDEYVFRDESGSITVEIEDEEWNGQEITPEDLIDIEGEIDRDYNRFKVEVDSLVKVAK